MSLEKSTAYEYVFAGDPKSCQEASLCKAEPQKRFLTFFDKGAFRIHL